MMLQIVLGVGILLGDAHIIHFTEGPFDARVPDYIANSPWTAFEYDKCQNYICKVQADMVRDVQPSRYVRSVAAQRVPFLTEPISPQKKQKASTGEPSHLKAKTQKVVAQPPPLQTNTGGKSDGGESSPEAEHEAVYVSLGLAKPGPQLNLPCFRIRKSTRNRREPEKFKNFEKDTVGKGKQRAVQGSGKVKKRDGRKL